MCKLLLGYRSAQAEDIEKARSREKSLYFELFDCQIPLDGCRNLNFLIENFFMGTCHFSGDFFDDDLQRLKISI